ncbi:hypothetical protein OBBRIDRAFT_832573 [Obba rivulosa]|uniref:Uncharacterized protein n=1 Tax=Obba rivulosa TaxID=1052685 RepID=A0A8E2J2T4_9APHY|nr:hypothetical protein OBBRIDRAFT_832573 [Obba rivulosa]
MILHHIEVYEGLPAAQTFDTRGIVIEILIWSLKSGKLHHWFHEDCQSFLFLSDHYILFALAEDEEDEDETKSDPPDLLAFKIDREHTALSPATLNMCWTLSRFADGMTRMRFHTQERDPLSSPSPQKVTDMPRMLEWIECSMGSLLVEAKLNHSYEVSGTKFMEIW